MLHQRLLRLINGHPNETNYFAWQALHRSYPGPGDRCLPPYLQRRQYSRMRDGAGLIIPVHANLRQFLENLPARELDAVILLDSQDWMAADEIAALWNAIDRTGSDGVRVIFRTAGTDSPLEGAELAGLRQIWRRGRRAQRHRLRAGSLRESMAASTATSGADFGFRCPFRLLPPRPYRRRRLGCDLP